MRYSRLGSSGLEVSRICLGTMTWGTQNNQSDADQQIDYALDQGINFIDTAELYSIPPNADTYGKTEKIIGNWLTRNPARRGDFVLMSKIAGSRIPWIREGADITGENVISSVDASLQRLNTDYIDVYQLHWPNRLYPHFARHGINQIRVTEKIEAQREIDSMRDILQGLSQCIKQGKIRHAGISNDTPWGLSQFLRLSRELDLPRMVSIQNEFNLLDTKDWPYFIEQCVLEDVAYLPWSPLAAGMLSGKYLDGARPAGTRWTMEQRNGLFRDTQNGNDAVHAYQKIATAHGMTTAEMALKWVDQVDGVTSTIIGATSMEQLVENINAFEAPLDESLISTIEKTRTQYAEPY